MIIGIDLGTTFSAVATINHDGRPEVITNRDGERTTPSVVMFEDGAVVVGEQAKENSIVSPYNVCQFVKRQMGVKEFSFDVSMTEKYSSEDISAIILKRLKEDAEAATGEKAEGAVITVPAYFNDAQRKATQDAGEIAGLKVLGIINEPTAAAIAYCYGQNGTDGNVMVYDLGGGTFDVTIMRLSDNLDKVDILSTYEEKNLGGYDLDNVIIIKVVDAFNEKYGEDLEDDDIACQDLRIKAENAKKALSSRNKASVSIVSGGKALKVDITKEEFEQLINKYVERTKVSMDIAMEDAHLEWRDISKILLVGGSTRIPCIQEMIEKTSGIKPSKELNPDEAVAIGAAYYATMLHSQSTGNRPTTEKTIQVTDVNSHSLGIITHDDNNNPHMTPIINRNTPLPCKEEQEFYTMVDGQSAINVMVVEGEDEDPEYDTVIGQAMMNLSPRPKGSPLSVSMEYDTNGLIHVRVFDGVDGRDLGEMNIQRGANLSDEEVKAKRYLIDKIDIE